MSSRASRIDTGMSVSFLFSAVIHLAVFLLLAWYGLLSSHQISIQETYYVDVINLPTADPRSDDIAQKQGEPVAVSPPAPVPPMTIPTPSPKNAPKAKTDKRTASSQAVETESAFAERMAKLEGKAEAQRYEDEMKRLSNKKKISGSSKAGAPEAGGTEAGSRYEDFIKSRIDDALVSTSSYTTKKPVVEVWLTIAADGKLLRVKIERSSGDATFELAVKRAIDLASKNFRAPPNRTVFEKGFVFVTPRKSNGISR